ncbi:MAG: hypothetical protein B6U95_06605 [Thermofilum sp. ex4484_82]|nr:MAG: hypothetical protein B6U95_06605 [Thermofilum sp. ex4484_82]OYT37440.1 MAG: hypothetical protein B6U96_06600 [Archaeoglobales archaeon ex4484_92]
MERRFWIEGFGRLKNAFMLEALTALLGIITSVISLLYTGNLQIEELSPEHLGYFIIIAILGLILALTAIISWIFKILGWGSICKTNFKKFYCYTRLAIIILPIIGISMTMIAGFIIGLQLTVSGHQASPEEIAESVPATVKVIAVLGSIIASTGFVIEAISLFDISIIYSEPMLKIGSIIYITSLAASIFQQVLALPINVANAIGIIAAILIFLSLNKLKQKLMKEHEVITSEVV